MLIACEERIYIDGLKKLFSTTFNIMNLGNAKKILGMKIIRNKSEGSIFFSQENFIKNVVEAFGYA